MFLLADLKPQFRMTGMEIECPVQGCDSMVTRPRKGDVLRSCQFLCNKCEIYISPSTFEYKDEKDNLLWNEADDSCLLAAVKASKAEVQRLARERSEDAVSWNVFRYFHRSGRLREMLRHFVRGTEPLNIETVFWSYSDILRAPWSPLLESRVIFGEAPNSDIAALGKRVSEPDLAFITDDHLIFVEAKFGSGNATSGKPEMVRRRIENPKNYLLGANCWYDEVFVSDYSTVVRDQKYELMRFWLLGSWIAKRLEKKFLLVNLVRKATETQIETDFGRHISQSDERRFVRWAWESLEPLLKSSDDEASKRLHEYMIQKTIGFCEFKDREMASPIRAFSMSVTGK